MLPKFCPVCSHNALAYNERSVSCQNCHVYNNSLLWWQRPLGWSVGRTWWWRLLILVWFVMLLGQNLKDDNFALNRISNPFSALDMGMHELGHMLFSPLGEFLHIAGGSIFQLLFPLLWMIGFVQKKWYFAASMCLCWLGASLFDVATYAGDARARLLPLAGGPASIGIDPSQADAAYDSGHDWYQMLGRLDALQYDTAIASGLRIAGTIAFIAGFILGFILILQMLQDNSRHNSN